MMDKKWIIIICVIILLFVGFIAFYNSTNNGTELKIDDTTFQLPNGYHIGNSEKENVTNLTNGTNEIYIQKYDDKNVKKHIKSYIDYSKENNRSANISNFTVGETVVYKSNINTSSTVHYWFVKNNSTYSIYSWDENPEIDSITMKLIESAK